MSVPRLMMAAAMLLLLLGLISGLSLHDDPRGMTVELTCLALSAAIFLGARQFEKKRGR